MPHFTKRFRTDFGNPEFTFDRLFACGGFRYHIFVLNQDRKTCVFNMEIVDKRWRILYAPTNPAWIIELEAELSNAIIKHAQPA
jgi:hypothetical protein